MPALGRFRTFKKVCFRPLADIPYSPVIVAVLARNTFPKKTAPYASGLVVPFEAAA